MEETNFEVNDSMESNESHDSSEASEKMVSAKAFWAVKQEAKKFKSELENYRLAEEERKNKDLSEAERWKKEYEKTSSILKQKEIKEKKFEAFQKAKSSIGDGYSIEEVESKLFNQIEKLSFNEDTYLDDIAGLMELAKRPKKTIQANPINLGTVSGKEKDPLSYTDADIKRISREDPEEAERILAARREARKNKNKF